MYEIGLEKIKNSILAASNNLGANKEIVNDLNVFPVPDGDTGTNMNMTIKSAVKIANESNSKTIKELLQNYSKGSLLGARGNSGVILSQLIRGFVEAIPQDAEVLVVQDLVKSFVKASEVAYNAVMKPTEGTILTVSKDIAKAAKKFPKNRDNVLEFLDYIYAEGVKSLNRTPDLLPILKESGVVDAGGKGLLCILEGVVLYLNGNEELLSSDLELIKNTNKGSSKNKYDYSVEFSLIVEKNKEKETELNLKTFLYDFCELKQIKFEDNVLKIKLDTSSPGKVLDKSITFGNIFDIKVENLNDILINKNDSKAKDQIKYKNAFISVSAGDGFDEVFHSLGVAKIISGGQTMNPSTEDLLSAVNDLDAENIFILPNNSNIILAAEQVKNLSEKNIFVIPTRSMPEGVSALFNGINEEDPEDIISVANEAISNMTTGEVTYAVRETTFNGSKIEQGDIIAINGKEIISKGNNASKVTEDLIGSLYKDEDSLISIYYGKDTKTEDAENLQNKIESLYPDVDVELTYGGQPLYYYIISIE